MISTKNIQLYINFLHFKKYLLPANEVLLGKWASLSDIEIRSNLDGLYQHWGFSTEIAKEYEAEFLASQQKTDMLAAKTEVVQQVLIPPANNRHVDPEIASESNYDYYTKDSSGGIMKFVLIGAVLLLIGLGAWYITNKSTVDQEKIALEKKVVAADQVANTERQIREARDSAIQRQAYEKAEKINEFKANKDRYIKHKVKYTYDGFFGGIKNVNLEVVNDADFKMDEIVVMLSYIKKNGDLYESKKISVYNIPPHQSKNIVAPSSKRGVKIESRIVSVQSDEVDQPGL